MVLLIIASNFLYTGKIAADYFLNNVSPYTFFRDGKFLVLFQNNSELRATGGFIGSFAELEIKDYEVKSINFNTNIYKLDSAYRAKNYIKAPAPIDEFNKGKSWTLCDSNYDISLPEASKDIESFYRGETGGTVDGIITVNATFVQDLLKLTGPIPMPKYNLVMSADNFFYQTEFQVEKVYYQDPENWVQNEPKTILKDLYPEVLSRALKQNKIDLLQFVRAELRSKEVQFFFNNAKLEELVQQKGWGGEVFSDAALAAKLGKNSDYLNVNVSNFGGNKSSFSVLQEIDYQVDESGLSTLTITRTHRGSTVWPDGANSSYVRVLAPNGSKIQTASLNDSDIKSSLVTDLEAGKATFATTILVQPQETSVLRLTYQLPFAVKDYRLAFQKQSGEEHTTLKVFYADKILYNGKVNKDLLIK